MRRDFDAIAFDLDGTLYPDYRLNYKLLPFLLRHWRLLAAFGKARDQIRREQEQSPASFRPDFYEYQAQLTAERLSAQPEKIRETIERLIYRGWEPLFLGVRLYPQAVELIAELKAAGYKLGLLSDFPPETKIKHLGIGDCWDAVLGSETTGALKPALRPFICLAEALKCAPERMLYVGNSYRYDVLGATRAGMKTALITSPFKSGAVKPGISFVFNNYRQLRNFVLQ